MKVFSSKFKQILAIILIVCLTFANNSFYLFASQTEFPMMESKDVSDYTDEAESEDSKLNNESIESDEIESRENLDASKPAGSHSGDNKSGVGESDNSRMGELSEPGNRNIASASDLDDDTDSEESKDIDTGEEPEDELGIASTSEADEDETSQDSSNELRNITHKGLSAKYLFSRDGYMLTGLTGYQNKIYYFNEFGPYIGSAYVGTVYAGGGHATFNSEGELVYNGTKEDMTRSGIPVQSASLTQGW